jgi:hypothetical protein
MSSCLLAETAEAAPKPPAFLRTCTISVPDPVPLFPNGLGPTPKSVDASSSDDEPSSQDDEDDDDDDDDEDDESPRGFISPGSNTCVAISGTLNFGIQRDWYKANALARATGLVPTDATSFPLSMSLRFESAQTLTSGLFVATAFEFSVDATNGGENDATLVEASVTLGPWVFGATDSRFDFWGGDEFIFIARIPSRTVGIIGYELALTDTLKISLSAEDIKAGQSGLPSPATRRVPDGVARLLYEGDELTLHGAVALREVPALLGGSSRLGRAAIIGATWERDVLGRPMSLSGQLAGAVDAAPYIGSQLDRRAIGALLTGDDSTRGWSGVVSLGREWTDTWSTNAYVSRYQLSLPQLGIRPGRISIDRFASNIVWKPLNGFKTGIEASIAWQRADLVGRALAASLAGRQASVQMFLERTF